MNRRCQFLGFLFLFVGMTVAAAQTTQEKAEKQILQPGKLKVGYSGSFAEQTRDFYFQAHVIHNENLVMIRCVDKYDSRNHGKMFLLKIPTKDFAQDSVVELQGNYAVKNNIQLVGGTAKRGEVPGGKYFLVQPE
jgi:hypothetical protein